MNNMLIVTTIENKEVRVNKNLIACYYRENDYTVLVCGGEFRINETPYMLDCMIDNVMYHESNDVDLM